MAREPGRDMWLVYDVKELHAHTIGRRQTFHSQEVMIGLVTVMLVLVILYLEVNITTNKLHITCCRWAVFV